MTNAEHRGHADAWSQLTATIAEEGSGRHPHVRRLLARRAARRDLADAAHAICAVYGHQPGVADEALTRCVQPDACEWLEHAAAGFADERTALAHLVAGAGPLPSTPGQAESEAALAGVRHAVEMLARSDRGGCATGAVAALVQDWATIRALLDHAAECFAIAPPPMTLPSEERTAAAIEMLAASPATQRAAMFGACQLLAQHRGLWDLLAARASARS